MKTKLERFGYIAFGILLASVVYIFAPVLRGTVDAQNAKSEIMDEIVCRNLRIVDADGNTRILLWTVPFKNAGKFEMFGDSENPAVALSVKENKGHIVIKGDNDKPAVVLFPTENGGNIFLDSRSGETGVQLSTLSRGGTLVIYNKAGEIVVAAGVDNRDRGFLKTADKNGSVIGSVPR